MKIFCGKCGSRAYPEGGIGIRDNSSIACFPCGNRTPEEQILHWIMLEMDGVKDARF